jgi:hypothetical protein
MGARQAGVCPTFSTPAAGAALSRLAPSWSALFRLGLSWSALFRLGLSRSALSRLALSRLARWPPATLGSAPFQRSPRPMAVS